MRRFLEMFECLQSVKIELELDKTKDRKARIFINSMKAVQPAEVKAVIDYLCPLVDAINFCQSDSVTAVQALTKVNLLREWYKNHEPFGMSIEQVSDMFDKRIKMFEYSPVELSSFFMEKARPVDTDSLEVIERLDRISDEVERVLEGRSNYDTQQHYDSMHVLECANRASNEALLMMKNWKQRVGVNISQFLSRRKATYPILYALWNRIGCQCASSAAVERSFSAQALVHTPLRNRLGPEIEDMLLNIRCNCREYMRIFGIDAMYDWIQYRDSVDNGQTGTSVWV